MEWHQDRDHGVADTQCSLLQTLHAAEVLPPKVQRVSQPVLEPGYPKALALTSDRTWSHTNEEHGASSGNGALSLLVTSGGPRRDAVIIPALQT